MRKRVSILGATGSIGTSTLDLIERNLGHFEVVALTAAKNVEALADAALRTGAALAVIDDQTLYPRLKERLAGSGVEAACGRAALDDAAVSADWTMAAIVGCAGLEPVMKAVDAGKTIALANKEALVTAGDLMIAAARKSGATILPVDSEHNAIFQCLAGNHSQDVARLVLTASGGPFRSHSLAEMAAMTPAQAVAHPNWSMGAKISVDSATMMNKGLELIEAHHLFDLPPERIDIVVHPQSIIHSMVEYVDGSVIAQMGSPDMRIPISYTLSYPDRMETPAERLDLARIGTLQFEVPDLERFPALRLARGALATGPSASIALNAANEIAVSAFLDNRMGFLDIPRMVERVMDRIGASQPHSIADVLDIDREARALSEQSIPEFAA